ncbi:MAG: hypothetical protein ACE1ZO_01505, partial [Nitrospirales bacterium]
VVAAEDIRTLKTMVENHVRYTGSRRAQMVLDSWQAMLPKFVKVMPVDYKRVLAERKAAAQKASREEKVVAYG